MVILALSIFFLHSVFFDPFSLCVSSIVSMSSREKAALRPPRADTDEESESERRLLISTLDIYCGVKFLVLC